MIEDGAYDLTLHFSRKLAVPVAEQTGSKARSFTIAKTTSDKSMHVIVAFHSNSASEYRIDLASKASEPHSQKSEIGTLFAHKTAIRGISMSANDQLFCTNSFDSVKVWTVDLF